jgi:hypothetical protein
MMTIEERQIEGAVMMPISLVLATSSSLSMLGMSRLHGEPGVESNWM